MLCTLIVQTLCIPSTVGDFAVIDAKVFPLVKQKDKLFIARKFYSNDKLLLPQQV